MDKVNFRSEPALLHLSGPCVEDMGVASQGTAPWEQVGTMAN